MQISEEEHTAICLIKSFRIKKIVFSRNTKEYESIFEIKIGFWYKKIRIPFHYGFVMSTLYKIPLEMEKAILDEEGISISKEMLSEALIESFGDTFSSASNL